MLFKSKIGSEEIADWEIGDRTAVGDALSLETPHVWPLRGRARSELLTKLSEEPRFPYARLAHETHHLPTPLPSLCQQLVEKRQLAFAADKAAHREPPRRRCVVRPQPEHRVGPDLVGMLSLLQEFSDLQREPVLHDPSNLG